MKNIRGALFLLSLSIVILFSSITIAQSKAPTIWVCSTTSSSYTLIKFKSLNALSGGAVSDYGPVRGYSPKEKKKMGNKNFT